MLYDGGNPLHAVQARARLEKFIAEKKIFEQTEKKPRRTRSQNSYLHVILAYFASLYGETERWVKERFYKRLVNPDIFIITKHDRILGTVKDLRSSADLDTREMTLSIERFRSWSAKEAGIYLPAPDEERLIQLMELEVERNKEFI